jgi:hypothetical protein
VTRILKALKGRERLVTVFWGYCIVGTFAVGAVLFALDRVTQRANPSWRPIAAWATGALFVIYFVLAHISLWTCAFNTRRRGWGYAARCYAVAVVIYYFAGISGNFGSGAPGIRQVLPPRAENHALSALRATVRLA